MALGASGGQRYHSARGTDVYHIGEEDDERAAPVAFGASAKRRCVIRFCHRCRDTGQRVPERAEGTGGSCRGDVTAYERVEDYQTDAIAGGESDVREGQCRCEGVLEARSVAGELSHHSAAVDRDHDGLALLYCELARDEAVTACGGLPVDAAWIIAGHIVAEIGERRSGTAAAYHALTRGSHTVLRREEPIAASISDGWDYRNSIIRIIN